MSETLSSDMNLGKGSEGQVEREQDREQVEGHCCLWDLKGHKPGNELDPTGHFWGMKGTSLGRTEGSWNGDKHASEDACEDQTGKCSVSGTASGAP